MVVFKPLLCSIRTRKFLISFTGHPWRWLHVRSALEARANEGANWYLLTCFPVSCQLPQLTMCVQSELFHAPDGYVAIDWYISVKGHSPNERDAQGRTVVMQVAQFASADDEAGFGFLLDPIRADLLATDNDGKTALFYAAEAGNLAMVNFLLSEESKLKQVKNKHGQTAGMAAFAAGHKWLGLHIELHRPRDPMVRAFLPLQSCSFHCVSQSGDGLHVDLDVEGLLSWFLPAGSNVNEQDEYGWTLLVHAVVNGRTDLARSAIARKADVNIADNLGRTALHFAAKNARTSLCRLLLEAGANRSLPDHSGRTASQLAGMAGYKEEAFFVDAWTSSNPEVVDGSAVLYLNAVPTQPKLPPLHNLAGSEHEKLVSEAAAMLESGNSKIDARDLRGGTALMWAVYYEKAPLVAFLISQKADLDALDDDGDSALIIAARRGSCGAMLIEAGADRTIKNKAGVTAKAIVSSHSDWFDSPARTEDLVLKLVLSFRLCVFLNPVLLLCRKITCHLARSQLLPPVTLWDCSFSSRAALRSTAPTSMAGRC